MPPCNDNGHRAWRQLVSDTRSFRPRAILELAQPPSALEFMRFVARNQPFVVRGGAKDWPAVLKWTPAYLKQLLGHQPITVAITPNGYADAVLDDKYFVQPYQETRPFAQVVDLLDRQRQVRQALQRGDALASQVLNGEPQLCHHYYVQSQDNNINSDFTALKPDIPNEIMFASEALEKAPDAVNFWMGDTTSVTSLHKDPYENIYVVVAGSKTFTLIPPTENCCLYEQYYTSAEYVLHRSIGSDGSPQEEWSVKASDNRIPWIPVDPCDTSDASHARFPEFHATALPLSVTVNKGDMFYLPALWYHHVQQHSESGEPVIAVNYWYDMDYGTPLFPYFEFTQALLANSNA